MANARQTGRKSTGGKAPRKQIAVKAARSTKQDGDRRNHFMFQLSERTDIIKVSKSSAAAAPPHDYHI
ncbi:unnamed protein product [Chondrus crispus]|uniref:Histone H2A/H2B/H3 domain-containing protein n=1 Tax=Chondrus crispus TaxID=2769 RepID=R7Q3B9_CHOCR|nr:unnamed protein product [Chondrus crispus]CDF32489.1 unnamed protein product [Chondrus crispus]|eukprot:XP_005712154.1 unnamed protein product [Chondrus crispus]